VQRSPHMLLRGSRKKNKRARKNNSMSKKLFFLEWESPVFLFPVVPKVFDSVYLIIPVSR